MIEIVSADRCILCNKCVEVCPTNVFDAVPDAPPSSEVQLAEKLDRRHPLYTIRRIIAPSVSGSQLLRDIRQDF